MKKDTDKFWDEIDKISNENGGHYVVPTVFGEVDTSEVSEYIRKQKGKNLKGNVPKRRKPRVGIPYVPLDPKTRRILDENQRIINKNR